MRRVVVFTFVTLLFTLPVIHAQAPPPPPEAKRLAYYVGTWNFSGTAKDSPMGKGGPITYKEVCEQMDGGFSVVCRSDGKGPMGPMKAAAIMTYDTARKAYTYTAAESNMPVFTALGQVNGPMWTWTTTTSEGGQSVTVRVTTKEVDAKSFEMTMEISMDGKTFTQFVSGKGTRAS